MRRVFELMWKEVLELRQDPKTLPLVLRRADHPADAARVCRDHRRQRRAHRGRRPGSVGRSRAADRIASSSRRISRSWSCVHSRERIDPYLQRAEAWLALTIPCRLRRRAGQPDAGDRADRGRRHPTPIRRTWRSAMRARSGRRVRRGADRRARPGRRPAASSGADVRVWFNPQLESRVFMIPGVLALLSCSS